MKLSIFPSAKAHPKGKEEKVSEAFKFSFPNKPETVEIMDDSQLVEFVSQFAWSPFIFKEYRREIDFVSTDFLVFDIDEGLTIDECETIVTNAKLCCLCLPSPSHTPEAHRFRIILPLARSITNLEVYAQTWKAGAALFGVADEQCKDGCRGYFGSTTDDGFWLEGDFFTPVIPVETVSTQTGTSQGSMITVSDDINETITQIYGEKRDKVPEAVDHFVKNAHTGLKGSWTNDLSRFTFSLTLSGVDDSMIWDICEQLAPNSLDSKDKYQIKRAIKDGKAAL